jgi:hypothetical protein
MSQPPSNGYLRFAVENRRVLAFGFLMALGSSFGQTFCIGLFSPSIEATFELSHSEWGSIYMAGTLLSAATLTFTGRWINKLNFRTYALAVCGFLRVVCLDATLMAMTSVSLVYFIGASMLMFFGGRHWK